MHNSAHGEEEHAPSRPFDPADLRGAPRQTLLIRAAKLVIAEAEYLCILRDVSETGLSLRLFHDLPAARHMILELQNEDRHDVELVWKDGERMGMRFQQRVDINRMIEMPTPFDRRPIRVRLNLPAVIGVGEDTAMCAIRDLSQCGAKVACTRTFALDQRVRLVASGLPKVQGKIRWRRDGCVGLSFENNFQLGELALLIAALHADTAAQPVQTRMVSGTTP